MHDFFSKMTTITFLECECMNDNLYDAHKKLPRKNVRVHSVGVEEERTFSRTP